MSCPEIAAVAISWLDQPLLPEAIMKKSNCYPITIIVGLLAAAPAFAQSQQTQTQQPQGNTGSKTVQSSNGASQNGSQGTNGATKQKTQGNVTEVGPASKAYYGNSLRPKY